MGAREKTKAKCGVCGAASAVAGGLCWACDAAQPAERRRLRRLNRARTEVDDDAALEAAIAAVEAERASSGASGDEIAAFARRVFELRQSYVDQPWAANLADEYGFWISLFWWGARPELRYYLVCPGPCVLFKSRNPLPGNRQEVLVKPVDSPEACYAWKRKFDARGVAGIVLREKTA